MPSMYVSVVPSTGASGGSWGGVPEMFRNSPHPLPAPWDDIFGPLRRGRVDDLVVVGQFGQSIDARIATATGHSQYINGAAGLAHLHRLRALVDAVVVGVGTALADDPQLTVRRVAGPSPARVVVDPNGRLPPTARLLDADGIRRLVLTGEATRTAYPAGVEVVRLPMGGGHIAPAAMLAALAERGLRRILIEGRRRHRLALPRRRLPRPAARGDRADHHRSRAIEHHAAADRAGRAGRPRADACPCPGRGGAARLRPVGSALAGRPSKNVDMTDAHA